MRRVVVTGLGCVTPLGVGVRRSWSRLIDGYCGIVTLKHHDDKFAKLPSRIAGLVPRGLSEEGAWSANEWLKPDEVRRMAKFTQYAISACDQALEDSGWHLRTEEQREATGVCFGSGIGNLEEVYDTSVAFERDGYKKVSALFVPRLLINMAAGHIAMRYKLQGPNHAAATACTTGAHSIGDAARFVACGDADVMLAGASESCVHPLALAGFARARSLAIDWNESPEYSARPFDTKRAGFVIGEGAGALVLEELEHAKARRANIYAELKGYGLSCDAHHMTTPREDGQGAMLAMKRALRQSGISPSKVDYVNAHATSTILGDAAENRAVKAILLGEDGKRGATEINVSSTKGATGHLLGAAGSVEAIFTVLAISEGVLPPTLNLDVPGDPRSDFDCNYVAKVAQQQQVHVALTNSFGFGGTNASLCFAGLA